MWSDFDLYDRITDKKYLKDNLKVKLLISRMLAGRLCDIPALNTKHYWYVSQRHSEM